MADHPRQIAEGELRFVQHRVEALGQGLHCKAEDRPAIHRDGGGAVPVRPSGVEDIAAPCAQRQGEGGVSQPENGGSGPVAEEDAGGAVGGVHQAGESLAPDDKGVLPAQRFQQPPRHGHAVQKAGAGRVDVQRGPVLRQTQRCLHLTGHAGGGVRGGEGGADAAGDIRRGEAAAFQRLTGSGNGQRGGRLFRRAPVPGADAGAAFDPRIAGVNHLAQLVVGDRAAGQGPAGGGQ